MADDTDPIGEDVAAELLDTPLADVDWSDAAAPERMQEGTDKFVRLMIDAEGPMDVVEAKREITLGELLTWVRRATASQLEGVEPEEVTVAHLQEVGESADRE